MVDKKRILTLIDEMIEEAQEEPQWKAESALKCLKKELLKEQEAVKPKSKVRHGAYAQVQHFCGICNAMLHGKPNYCSNCGRKVKWDERASRKDMRYLPAL